MGNRESEYKAYIEGRLDASKLSYCPECGGTLKKSDKQRSCPACGWIAKSRLRSRRDHITLEE